MAIPLKRQYQFTPPELRQTLPLFDYTQGLNSRDQDNIANITKANNVRIGRNSGFDKRPGTLQKGQQIGTASKILGLHSYINKSAVANLLATYNSDIYKFTETSSPNTIATSSVAQATGYSKDRHMFFTTNLDTNSQPWLVATYQSGSGIILEWSAYPYSSWANTPITIDTSTQIGWSIMADSSDNIHVAYMSDANTVKYVKLTYAAGPTWSVGSKTTVYGSVTAAAANPSVYTDGTTDYVGFRYFDPAAPGTYNLGMYSSSDNFATISNSKFYTTPDGSTANHAISILNSNTAVIQTYDSTNTRWGFGYWFFLTGGSNISYSTTAGTLNAFTTIYNSTDATNSYYRASSASSTGVTMTSFGTITSSNRKIFDVVNDGSNDNDIQYRNIIGGVEDTTSTRITNDSNNNIYPSSPALQSSVVNIVPVMFMVGTSNPYSIKINSFTQWVALSASLTAGNTMESAYFPSTGAGGTDQIYFSNGVDTAKKWDGTTLTSATATNYPVAKQVVFFENHLWYFNLTSSPNRSAYTNLGADNFSSPATFPSGNTVDFPGYLAGGIVYRDHMMLVFTREGIYAVQNFDYSGANEGPENTSIKRIPNSYGTLSIRSVQQIGYWVYFQSPDGQIRRTNGQYVEEPATSDIIRPTIEALSLSQLQNSASGKLKEFYYLAVPAAGSGQNDTVIVLDTLKAPQGGFSIDTGKYVSVFTSHIDNNGVPTLYYGDSRTTMGNIYQVEVGTNDNGSAIDMDLQTGTKFLSSTFYKSRLRDILPLAEASGNWNLTIGIARSTNINSFLNYQVSLNPNSGTWGTGTWGTGKWGGNTTIETSIHPNIIDQGFKIRYRNNAADQPVSVQGSTLVFEVIRDKP